MSGLRLETLQAKGQLAELKNEASRLEMSIKGDITAVRNLLSPRLDVVDIQADVAAAQAVGAGRKVDAVQGAASKRSKGH